MSGHSDKTLVKILTEERANYQEKAVDAAQQEFSKRNLNLANFSGPPKILAPGEYAINRMNVSSETEPNLNSASSTNPAYDAARKEQANKDMMYGALWCVGGIIATMSDIGAIFWGAIIFGAIQFFKGLSNS